MKGNIKKLALVVIIASIPMLIVVATASAAGKTIQGDYASTVSGQTITAVKGFNASLQPNDGVAGLWFTGSFSWDGVLSFNKDGTGSFTANTHATVFYSTGLGAPPSAGSGTITWDFTYTIDKEGNITFTYVTGSFEQDWTTGPNAPPSPNSKAYANIPQPWYGTISPDGKTISVLWGAPSIIEATVDKANTTPSPTGAQLTGHWVLHGFKIND